MSYPFAIKLDEALAEGFCRQLMLLARAAGAPDESVQLLGRAARAVSRATSQGHVCLLLAELLETDEAAALEHARRALFASGMVADSQAVLPLVLDREDRLYLARYFDYERRLAAMLLARADALPPAEAVDEEDATHLSSVFAARGERADWQKLAVAMAIRNRLTIISGGPGTGKTTTVVNLLACLLGKEPKLRIALAAPTGKAAQRMQDAIRKRAGHLPEGLRALLPKEASTIHRLLGVIPDSCRFRHHADNPLALDVLIVDEASMLDLALATKLVAAVPEAARLIFLGDKDQLAAVEAGAVFGEISADPTLSGPCREQLARVSGLPVGVIQPPPVAGERSMADVVIWLTENYRFGQYSGIGRLALAINTRDEAAATRCLRGGADKEGVRWVEDGGVRLGAESMAGIAAGFNAYLQSVRAEGDNPSAVFAAWERFRILCAVRDSERGVQWLNEVMATTFRQRLRHAADDGHTPWYPGRPLMVIRNDYVLKLFNGDIGIVLPTPTGLMAHFQGSGGTFRVLAPPRLPPHETAFAMTVHKAQGSEFEAVALVLPAHGSAVLSKELLYTAVTRARRSVTLYGSDSVLNEAIGRQTVRHSGLSARLRSGG